MLIMVQFFFITLSAFSFKFIAPETTTTKLKLPASLIADRLINNYDFLSLRKQGISYHDFCCSFHSLSEEHAISCYSVAVWPCAEFSFLRISTLPV